MTIKHVKSGYVKPGFYIQGSRFDTMEEAQAELERMQKENR